MHDLNYTNDIYHQNYIIYCSVILWTKFDLVKYENVSKYYESR